ncbi:MAG: hypothetical protein PHR36_02140 [Patescibacteria group bacterium]|nr:hypothetical protein [Patescibacteria group bacterium]
MKPGDCFTSISDVEQNLGRKQSVVVRHKGEEVIIHGEPRISGHPVGDEDLRRWLSEAKKMWPDQEVKIVYGYGSREIGKIGEYPEHPIPA